ncbi:MAG: ankyrin repeat domain-containing protein, partial [Blastocatellia bacterium]|nr:ankyrin repeat domain-containing protein [Blastocatellia bacterium]
MPSSDTLTLLEAALSSGDLGRVQQLLDSGVKLNRRLPGGRTALSEAAASLNWLAREPIVAALLKSGADPNERDTDSKTPLMTAAISGCGSLVVRLVAAGALLETEDDAGVSALSYAAAWALCADRVPAAGSRQRSIRSRRW